MDTNWKPEQIIMGLALSARQAFKADIGWECKIDVEANSFKLTMANGQEFIVTVQLPDDSTPLTLATAAKAFQKLHAKLGDLALTYKGQPVMDFLVSPEGHLTVVTDAGPDDEPPEQ